MDSTKKDKKNKKKSSPYNGQIHPGAYKSESPASSQHSGQVQQNKLVIIMKS